MPQFPMTDSRRRVLEKIPDYAVIISPADKKLVVRYQDMIIAESTSALVIAETRHGAVYYLPREDVDMSVLQTTELSTYCPFKGHASYWSLKGEAALDNFVWSYEDPYPEVIGIKNAMSFYTDKVEVVVE
jgi:uncharacterized protein (DUF427 family)